MRKLTGAVRVLGLTLCLGWGSTSIAAAQEDELDCIDFEFQEEAQAALDADPSDPNGLDPGGDGIACALLPSRDGTGGDATPVADEDALDATVTPTAAGQTGNDDSNATERDRERKQEERRAARQEERDAEAEATPTPDAGNGNQENRDRQRNRNGDAVEESTCDDFATQEEAQDAFDANPGRLADLDSDGDSLACAEGDDVTLPSERDDGTGGLLVCDDFLTQEEAQAAFDDDPADLADLDTDGDGRACARGDNVTLPSEEDDTRRVSASDLDCIDFDTQEEAQDELDADPDDPNNLDPSGDGFACSELPSEDGRTRVTTVPSTGSGPGPVGDSWPVAAAFGGVTVAIALGGLGRRLRSSDRWSTRAA